MSSAARAFPLCVCLATAAFVGCGGPPPEAVQSSEHLRQLARLCGNFTSANKGNMPANVEELKKFARSNKAVAEPDSLFISPRDNEPYELILTVKMSMPGVGTKTILAHEKTGVGGRRYVAYNTLEIEEVDDAKFQEFLAKK